MISGLSKTALCARVAIEDYYVRALVCGVDRERASNILDEEMERARESPEDNAANALGRAKLRLPLETE